MYQQNGESFSKFTELLPLSLLITCTISFLIQPSEYSNLKYFCQIFLCYQNEAVNKTSIQHYSMENPTSASRITLQDCFV